MMVRRKLGLAAWTLIAVTMPLLFTHGCHSRGRLGDSDGGVEPAGEPEQYSATLVRIVEDGTRRETSVSSEARSGEQRREEWTEQGQHRALIWRPDLGRSFLLDLDSRSYVEVEITDGHSPASRAGPSNPHDAAASDAGDGAVQAIDQYFDDTQPPTRVETRVLPPVTIDGHPCAVYEERSVFPDGHSETTKRFRARDLSGLALRVESEAEHGSPKVITERRNVRIEVAPDAFIVPVDFKKVEKLPR